MPPSVTSLLTTLFVVTSAMYVRCASSDYTFLGGTSGGTYGPLARQTVVKLNEDLNRSWLRFNYEQSKGSADNLRRIQNGEAHFAFVSGAVLISARDRGWDQRENPRVSIVARLRTDYVQMVVCKDKYENANNLLEFLESDPAPRIYTGSIEGTGTGDAADWLFQLVGKEDLPPIDEDIRSYDDAFEALTKRRPDAAQLVGKEDLPRIDADIHACDDTSDALTNPRLDAALFIGAFPTPTVYKLMKTGNFKLLPLSKIHQSFQEGRVPMEATEAARDYVTTLFRYVPGPDYAAMIPGEEYPNQNDPIETLVISTYLICPRSLPVETVEAVTRSLYDRLYDLRILQAGAEELRPWDMFKIPTDTTVSPDSTGRNLFRLSLHPGAVEAKNKIDRSLMIATGAFGGKYHAIGIELKRELAKLGEYATVTHSDGSFENAEYLVDPTKRRGGGAIQSQVGPVIALMQEDAALVAHSGDEFQVYGAEPVKPRTDSVATIEKVRELRHLATLHSERMHVLMRRDWVDAWKKRAALKDGRRMKIGIGARNSGSQLTSRAILTHYFRNTPRNEMPDLVPMPVNKMFNTLKMKHDESGKRDAIDVAMFASYTPSDLIRVALRNQDVVVHELEPSDVFKRSVPALRSSTIDTTIYRPVNEHGWFVPRNRGIPTVETRALLVATENLTPELARKITEALTRAVSWVLPELKPETLARKYVPLEMHKGAKDYYISRGWLPPGPDPFDWFGWLSNVGVMIVFLSSIYGFTRQLSEHKERKQLIEAITSPAGAHAVELLNDREKDLYLRLRLNRMHPKAMRLNKYQNWMAMIERRKEEIQRITHLEFLKKIDSRSLPGESARRELVIALKNKTLSAPDYENLIERLEAQGGQSRQDDTTS